jgi:predicted PhzF superfamily epimerase YddE/YHI9
VAVDSEATVRALAPDLAALARLPVRGVIVTGRAESPGYDFVSRFFAPGAGIPEDPVTGSAHCALAPYWAGKLGRSELVGYQASARGGVVRVRVAGDRVQLGGEAVTVMRGELLA